MRWISPFAATVCAAMLALVSATPASAINNTAPSRAVVISVGTPFSAVQPNAGADLWRLDRSVAPGERFQIAIDNTRGEDDLTVCVIGPTDDFGYDAEVEAACDTSRSTAVGEVNEGRSARLTLTYQRGAGQPLLRFSSASDRVTTYSATVEAVIPPPPPVPPDTDDDGVPDDGDACPSLVGPAPGGCPDRDSDGVPDPTDQCSGVAGPASGGGCPDRDGDGVRDEDDQCSTVPGPGPSGCPPPRPRCKVQTKRVKRGRSLTGVCSGLPNGARLEARWYRVTSRSRRATKVRSVYVTVTANRIRVPTTKRRRGSYRVSLWRDGSKLGSSSVRVR